MTVIEEIEAWCAMYPRMPHWVTIDCDRYLDYLRERAWWGSIASMDSHKPPLPVLMGEHKQDPPMIFKQSRDPLIFGSGA